MLTGASMNLMVVHPWVITDSIFQDSLLLFKSAFWENTYAKLVGGFNPFEKYWSKWESSPNRGEN